MKFSVREKRMLLVLGIVAGISVLYLVVVRPMIDAVKSSREESETVKKEAVTLQKLINEHRSLSDRIGQYREKLHEGESLVVLLEKNIVANNLASRKSYLRELADQKRNDLVVKRATLKFESAAMDQVVKFLAGIEDGPGLLHVRSFHCRQAEKGSSLYDVTITVSLYTR